MNYLINRDFNEDGPVAFPGTKITDPSQSEAKSHRRLTLLGSELNGAWVRNATYFRSDTQSGILNCSHVWWLEIGGSIPNVPVGQWEAEIPLKYQLSPPRKSIEWSLRVEDDDRAAIHLPTGPGHPFNFERHRRGRWVRYRMGTLTITKPNIWVWLLIRGTKSQIINNFSFGGLQLKPWSVDWRKEAILLRMLERNEERSLVGPKKGEVKHKDWVASKEAESNQDFGWLQMPRDVVTRIAQYLITPLPEETLLVNT